MSGWIKLHRDLREWKFYKKDGFVKLWIHMLLEANHSTEILFDGYGNEIKYGQFSTGILRLSKETGFHRSKIERMLLKLEIENQIERRRTSKCSIITIVEWDKYQSRDTDQESSEKQARSKREAGENRTRIKELKELKNNNIYSPFLKIWNEQEIIIHKENDAYLLKIGKRIKAKIKVGFSNEDIMQAIKNYGSVVRSSSKAYKWSLEEFLTGEKANKYYPGNFIKSNFDFLKDKKTTREEFWKEVNLEDE